MSSLPHRKRRSESRSLLANASPLMRVTLSQLRTLTLVQGDRLMNELAKELGDGSSEKNNGSGVLARQIETLDALFKDINPGLTLGEVRPDVEDKRLRRCALTPVGKRIAELAQDFLERLATIVDEVRSGTDTPMRIAATGATLDRLSNMVEEFRRAKGVSTEVELHPARSQDFPKKAFVTGARLAVGPLLVGSGERLDEVVRNVVAGCEYVPLKKKIELDDIKVVAICSKADLAAIDALDSFEALLQTLTVQPKDGVVSLWLRRHLDQSQRDRLRDLPRGDPDSHFAIRCLEQGLRRGPVLVTKMHAYVRSRERPHSKELAISNLPRLQSRYLISYGVVARTEGLSLTENAFLSHIRAPAPDGEKAGGRRST